MAGRARDAGGGRRRRAIGRWQDSPDSDPGCGSDYCGLFTKPAPTTCSHSTAPASDKPSSLQIETNDLPLPRTPTAQLLAVESARHHGRRGGGDGESLSGYRFIHDYKMLLKWIGFMRLYVNLSEKKRKSPDILRLGNPSLLFVCLCSVGV